MNDLTEINIYGHISEDIGQSQWHLQVSSIGEALHAININSNRKLYKSLTNLENRKSRYKILVNDQELKFPDKELEDLNEKDLESVADEFRINREMVKIDLVPVIEGGFFPILFALGAILGGVALKIGIATAIGAFLASMAIGLIFTGISMLLSKPPDFGDFREIQQVHQKDSYLFNGPTNYLGEGGPVPVGYGRLIVGSLGVQLNYFTEDTASPVQDTTAPTAKSVVTEIVYDFGKPGFGPQILGAVTSSSSLNPATTSSIIR